MAAQTYGDVWRFVALQVPTAPISLVQGWVQRTYDTLTGKNHWAWLRKETILTTRAQRTIDVVATQGSTHLTSAGLFLPEDVGRQIRATGATIYTIATVTDVNTADLTQAYAEDSGVITALVHDRYLVMPENFRSIYDVTDMSNQRPVCWWISRDRLDLYDPGRLSSDSRLRCLASYQLSEVPSLLGRLTYEAWPQPSAVGSYQLRYFIRTDTLTDDTLFQGVLATKTEALIEGALAWAARWPGTEGRKNPYFDLRLAAMHEDRFRKATQDLVVLDDDQYLMMLEQVDLSRFGLAAIAADTTLMRASDATISEYY